MYEIIKCKIATMMIAMKKGYKTSNVYDEAIWPSQEGLKKKKKRRFLKEIVLELKSKGWVIGNQLKRELSFQEEGTAYAKVLERREH